MSGQYDWAYSFSVNNVQFSFTVITGTTPVAPGEYKATGIIGFVNGVAISGLDTTYSFLNPAGPDNIQSLNPGFTDGVNTPGVSFDAAGVAYNIFELDGTTRNYFAIGSRFGADTVAPLFTTNVCFVSGTRIRVERDGDVADVAVEVLRVGDIAVTASGGRAPIRWIGHRELDRAFLAENPDSQPVRILAGAFGPNMPARGVSLSAGHPVLVGADADGDGGALVPIMCLINGTSVARERVDSVTYWHVELDHHDILLAEGLAAESFLDYGIRPWFENGADHALTNPDFIPPGLNGRCRPVAVDGSVVEAERQRIDMLFAMDLTAHCKWPGPDSVMTEFFA